jgi:hypothetical protein
MHSNDIDRSALFLAVPTTDGADAPGTTFDGGEEAMRRLRHPFAVGPSLPTTPAGEDRARRN